MATGDPSVFGVDTDLLMRWYYFGETWPGQRYRWSDADRKAMGDLLDKAAQTSDETARKALWKQALDMAADQVPLYPILHTKVVTAYDPAKVDGFSGASTTGLYFLGTGRTG